MIEIHPKAIENGIAALKKGCNIYTDTQMIKAGVNRRKFIELGGEICNFVHDEDVYKKAKERGITRSMVSIEKALTYKKIKIYAIGNAPTALFTLIKMVEKGISKPDLVIGVPVGFVGAEESKEALMKVDVPYIVTRGRKGGSTVAASIINSLLYMI